MPWFQISAWGLALLTEVCGFPQSLHRVLGQYVSEATTASFHILSS